MGSCNDQFVCPCKSIHQEESVMERLDDRERDTLCVCLCVCVCVHVCVCSCAFMQMKLDFKLSLILPYFHRNREHGSRVLCFVELHFLCATTLILKMMFYFRTVEALRQ